VRAAPLSSALLRKPMPPAGQDGASAANRVLPAVRFQGWARSRALPPAKRGVGRRSPILPQSTRSGCVRCPFLPGTRASVTGDDALFFLCWRLRQGGNALFFLCWRLRQGGNALFFLCWRLRQWSRRPFFFLCRDAPSPPRRAPVSDRPNGQYVVGSPPSSAPKPAHRALRAFTTRALGVAYSVSEPVLGVAGEGRSAQ